ncbi:MAG: T9SS type A sorting domain-containing protein [Candidatus Zixiibacteriota bacterium]|nr:MAG: T9SS type A sorting domain-containing protein [candidate division Zixibacteria bacterium]
MKTLVLFVSAFLFILPVYAQAQAPDTLWTRNYGFSGDDQAWQVQPTQDDGFIIVGMADVGIPSDLDMYLIKTDENGDSIWTRTYDYSTLVDVGRSVLPLNDGGFVVTGYSNTFGYDDDLILFKVDSLGSREWFRVYNDASGRSIKKSADGNFIIAGFMPGAAGDEDMCFIKTDTAGIQIWGCFYGGSSDERTWDICETLAGEFFIVGWTESIGAGGSDIFVIKTDQNGELIWSNTYGDLYNDEGRSILSKEDGGFVIAGKISMNQFSHNVTVINADSNGNVIWSRIFSDSADAIANSIVATSDGGYILTGMRRDSNYMLSGFVIKIDVNGDSLWSKIIRDPDQNLYCRSIVQTSDGGYVIAGYHQVPGHSNDVFLCKLAPDIVGIQDEIAILPENTTLHQNYPNPFNANTTVSFTLSEPQYIVLSVYDLLGRKISVLADGYFDAGIHDITFDAGDLSSGIYFYILKTGDISETKSMILLK